VGIECLRPLVIDPPHALREGRDRGGEQGEEEAEEGAAHGQGNDGPPASSSCRVGMRGRSGHEEDLSWDKMERTRARGPNARGEAGSVASRPTARRVKINACTKSNHLGLVPKFWIG